jgi:hypothetical protein
LETDLAMATEMVVQALVADLHMATVTPNPATVIETVAVDEEGPALVVAEVEGQAAMVAVIDMIAAHKVAIEAALEAVSKRNSPTRLIYISYLSFDILCTCTHDDRPDSLADFHLSMTC